MDTPSPEESAPVAVITGAGGRVGVAAGVCEALAAAGWRLVINDIDDDAVAETVRRYPGSLGVVADVRREDDVERLFAAAVAEFGQIHALVNNAGVGLDKAAHVAEVSDFDRLFSLNVKGLWLVTRAFADHRIARGGFGTVVNVSSVHAQHTQSGYALYAGTKAAVEGLTRGFAVELGPLGIRCNAVAPGAVLDVRMADGYGLPAPDPLAWIDEHARSRQAIPAAVAPIDVGRVVEFLLSERSASVIGQVITVDAGLATLLYDRRFTGHEQ